MTLVPSLLESGISSSRCRRVPCLTAIPYLQPLRRNVNQPSGIDQVRRPALLLFLPLLRVLELSMFFDDENVGLSVESRRKMDGDGGVKSGQITQYKRLSKRQERRRQLGACSYLTSNFGGYTCIRVPSMLFGVIGQSPLFSEVDLHPFPVFHVHFVTS
jgi:hypothetical protein